MKWLSQELARWSGAVGFIVAALTIAWSSGALAGTQEAGPDRLSDTRSMGEAIAASSKERPVHIIFVHGMRARGRGTAATFARSLCRELGPRICHQVTEPSRMEAPERLDIGVWPKDAKLSGRQIWSSETEWNASRPFVDRYTLKLSRDRLLVIDEVNWWPLLFPLKCRFLVAEDRKLSGFDRKDEAVCRNQAKDPSKIDWLASYVPAPGRQARGQIWGNKALKQEILNWGLSDAVAAVGPMRAYTRAAMRATFRAAAQVDGRTPEQQDIILVSESLGSFVVMDALRNSADDSALARVVAQTTDLYFFANQFALLEFGRISGVELSSETSSAVELMALAPGATPPQTPTEPGLLEFWARAPLKSAATDTRQIVAFSDPNDALTFLVPPITGVTVVNVYDRNFGLGLPFIFTDPGAAHTGHSRNRSVLRMMLRGAE